MDFESKGLQREWLVTNQKGSFAMGTPSRVPTRKYHGSLILRNSYQTDPLHILSEIHEVLITPETSYELGSFHYQDLIHPKGYEYLHKFDHYPNPTWIYHCDEIQIIRELILLPDADVMELSYSISNVPTNTAIHLFPYFTLRSIHHLTKENPYLNGHPRINSNSLNFNFMKNINEIMVNCNHSFDFDEKGFWNYGIIYSEEANRGYPDCEDIFCPGKLILNLSEEDNFSIQIGTSKEAYFLPKTKIKTISKSKPKSLVETLNETAKTYLIENQTDHLSIVAGFPWFGEWGRDTFISLPGLILEQERYQDAKKLLKTYLTRLKNGLVPNILGPTPEESDGHSVDATLWLIRSVQILEEKGGSEHITSLINDILNLIDNLRHTQHGQIKVDEQCLLYADARPRALTWMDALINGQAVTPRAPYAVDINALFYNAVAYGLQLAKRSDNKDFVNNWSSFLTTCRKNFRERFWLDDKGYLADSHDGDNPDFSLRPNQLLAISLPFSPITKKMGKSIISHVKKNLLTPMGLRTLSPDDPHYHGTCQGTQEERDQTYHQGTVWPWLLGPFADAVIACYGIETLKKWISPCLHAFEKHLNEACLGHISEIFDGDSPHCPRGAPAQAWSVAEILRVARLVETLPEQKKSEHLKPIVSKL